MTMVLLFLFRHPLSCNGRLMGEQMGEFERIRVIWPDHRGIARGKYLHGWLISLASPPEVDRPPLGDRERELHAVVVDLTGIKAGRRKVWLVR